MAPLLPPRRATVRADLDRPNRDSPVSSDPFEALFAEGWDRWAHFDREVRQHEFHPFVPADYRVVHDELVKHVRPGLKFLECGSAMGVITILADMLGFEAYGIELDDRLVRQARERARNKGSKARFASGSFLPTGYRYARQSGDGRLGTIGEGPSGYLELGIPLDDFDIVFAYPWSGEEPTLLDLMRAYGRSDALLLMYAGNDSITRYRGGRVVPR
jgi:hypothetical protein